MFAKALKADTDVELWHKRISHINLQKLEQIQSKGVVIRLSTFKEKEIEGVCEACQFGKQHRHPFPKGRNVSKGLLDVIHSKCGNLLKGKYSEDVDTMSPLSTTSLGTLGSFPGGKTMKCLHTSKNSKLESKRKHVGMLDAFSRTGEKSTSSKNFRLISTKKEFNENLCADTHRNIMEWPFEKTDTSSK